MTGAQCHTWVTCPDATLIAQEPEDAAWIFQDLAQILKQDVSNVRECSLQALPQSIDSCIYVHEKYPFVSDPSGRAHQFLKYNAGVYLSLEAYPDPAQFHLTLRQSFLRMFNLGKTLVIDVSPLVNSSVDNDLTLLLARVFHPDFFPTEILQRREFNKDEHWGRLLARATTFARDNPNALPYQPHDAFKLIFVSSCASPPRAILHARGFVCLDIIAAGVSLDSSVHHQVALAMGYSSTEIQRPNQDLVEAGFDGELEVIQAFLDKGYYLESADVHGHTVFSEAACQGHLQVLAFLAEQGTLRAFTYSDIHKS